MPASNLSLLLREHGAVELLRRYHRPDRRVSGPFLVSWEPISTHMPHLSVRYPTEWFKSVRSHRQHGVHLVADNGVTLACHVFESLAVNNNDPTPTILNDARLFELAGYQVPSSAVLPAFEKGTPGSAEGRHYRSDPGGLDSLPFRHHSQKGNHSLMGEIYVLNRFRRLLQKRS